MNGTRMYMFVAPTSCMIEISRRRAKTVRRIVFEMMMPATTKNNAITPMPTRRSTAAEREQSRDDVLPIDDVVDAGQRLHARPRSPATRSGSCTCTRSLSGSGFSVSSEPVSIAPCVSALQFGAGPASSERIASRQRADRACSAGSHRVFLRVRSVALEVYGDLDLIE